MDTSVFQYVFILFGLAVVCCGKPTNHRKTSICDDLLSTAVSDGVFVNEINDCLNYMPNEDEVPCPPLLCNDMPPCDFGFSVDEMGCKMCKCNTIYNGDISLSIKTQMLLSKMLSLKERQEQDSKERMLWTQNFRNGKYVVPFILDKSIEHSAWTAIAMAMQEIRSTTCIEFRHLRGDMGYHLVFAGGRGCFSDVGRIGEGNSQTIRIGYGCDSKGKVLHMLMHALGFWHEHTRPDRNQHIKIRWENIQTNYLQNFLIRDNLEEEFADLHYDINSIMQYNSYAFSANGEPTMTDQDNNIINAQEDQLSSQDIVRINRLYRCPNDS